MAVFQQYWFEPVSVRSMRIQVESTHIVGVLV